MLFYLIFWIFIFGVIASVELFYKMYFQTKQIKKDLRDDIKQMTKSNIRGVQGYITRSYPHRETLEDLNTSINKLEKEFEKVNKNFEGIHVTEMAGIEALRETLIYEWANALRLAMKIASNPNPDVKA